MVSFVILHYAHDGVTINCIESIRKCCKNSDYKIVIVDNASPNDSGKKIEEYISGSNDCVLLTAEKNLGFANGNNLGYKYAKEHFNPDYMFVMNNDTVLETEDVEKVLDRIHSETNFDVLGPDIYLPTGLKQNPSSVGEIWNKEETEKLIKKFSRIVRWYFLYFIGISFRKIKSKIFSRKKVENSPSVRDICVGRHENAHLFGACYIVAKSFIEQEENVFDPRTFLYVEENIFTCQNRKKGRKILYDDSIKVLHMHSVATKSSTKNKYKKIKKVFVNTLNSLKVYLQILEENGD